MRTSILVLTALFISSPVHAEATLYGMRCAASLLAVAGNPATRLDDPGPDYAASAFARIAKLGWRHFPGFEVFPMLSPVELGREGEVTMSDGLMRTYPHFGGGTTTFLTALSRLDPAVRRAKASSKFTARSLVVGRTAILKHLADRAETAKDLNLKYDSIQPGPAERPPASRFKLGAFALLTPAAITSVFLGSVFVLSRAMDHDYASAAAGLAAVAAVFPLLRSSVSTLYVHIKQGAIDRGWLSSPPVGKLAVIDDSFFIDRVAEITEKDDHDAFLYRGVRTAIPQRRTDAALPYLGRQRLPYASMLFFDFALAKGTTPAIDHRSIEHDELLVYDRDRRDWVLLGVIQ